MSVRVNQLGEKRREIFDYMDTLARLKRERRELQVDWNEEAHRRELDDARTLRMAAATKAAEIEAARNAAKLAEERAARERMAVTDRAEAGARSRPDRGRDQGTRGPRLAAPKPTRMRPTFWSKPAKNVSPNSARQARLNGEQSRRLERIRSVSSLHTEIEQHEATLAKAADLQADVGRLSELMGQITATDESVLRIEAGRYRAFRREEQRSTRSRPQYRSRSRRMH